MFFFFSGQKECLVVPMIRLQAPAAVVPVDDWQRTSYCPPHSHLQEYDGQLVKHQFRGYIIDSIEQIGVCTGETCGQVEIYIVIVHSGVHFANITFLDCGCLVLTGDNLRGRCLLLGHH